ncbi:FHA domain-containing protein [Kineosporia sp. J2-2]|uniref:FHA domain-containing protein n=1 Tax=Kineosporia corallincola TaxID=2835133 RepID=A0ABS5TLD4_9ACTN|nr:FHA domain-containing protein [Kineosporia corallincola]MBT0771891.1 FHA domain-containing protein [Kineosporia corallincola]
MSTHLIETGTTTLVPGDGLVHRGPGVVLVLPALSPAQIPQAQALLGACGTAAADPSGRTTVLAVAGLLTRSGESGLPAFGLGLDTDRGLVVLLHDEAQAEVSPSGCVPVRLRGTDSLAWVERRFAGPVDGLQLWTTRSPHPIHPGTGSAATEGIPLGLSRGTLHGSGVLVTPADHGETARPAMVPDPADVTDPADLTVTAERRLVVPPREREAVPGDERPTQAGSEPAHPTRTMSHGLLRHQAHGSSLPATPHLGQPVHEPPEVQQVQQAQEVQRARVDGFPIQPHLWPYAEPGGEPVGDEKKHSAASFEDDPETGVMAPQPLRTPGGGIAVPRPNQAPIEGVLCARGHFTDPQAAYCAICGISMQQVSRQITRRPRPPLGVLVLDDGSSMTVDGDLIIGRDPASHPAVVAGDAKPMFLNDEVDGVSRVHARITLVDWTVCLTDEDSANGTYVTDPRVDPQGRQPVRGEVPVALASGSVIRIGRRTITFDAFHSAGE